MRLRYNWDIARRDLAAGATVAAIAIPADNGVRDDCRRRSPIRSLFGDRRNVGRLDLRFLFSPD